MSWVEVKFALCGDTDKFPVSFVLDSNKLKLKQAAIVWVFWSPNVEDTPEIFYAREKRHPQKILKVVRAKEHPGYYKATILRIADTRKELDGTKRVPRPTQTKDALKRKDSSEDKKYSKAAINRNSVTQALQDLKTPVLDTMPLTSTPITSNTSEGRPTKRNQDCLRDDLLQSQKRIIELLEENCKLKVRVVELEATQNASFKFSSNSILLDPLQFGLPLASEDLTVQKLDVRDLADHTDHVSEDIAYEEDANKKGPIEMPNEPMIQDPIEHNIVQNVETDPALGLDLRLGEADKEMRILTEEEVKALHKEQGPNIKEDSMFVKGLLDILYKDQFHILAERSNTGAPSPKYPTKKPKQALTPYKANQIRTWFKWRLKDVGMDTESADFKKRFGKRASYISDKVKTCQPK